MSTVTNFLPAERRSLEEVQQQAEWVSSTHVTSSLLDASPQMVAILNPERQIVCCNDACARAGLLPSKEEAIGLRPGELLRCIHANEMAAGCGASSSCQYCGLALSIEKGSHGTANSGQCILQCILQCRNAASSSLTTEYAVAVQPLRQLGSGWQCYWLTDISHEKRRQALERTFFHDLLNRAAAVQGPSTLLADEGMAAVERNEFLQMLSVSSQALVDEIRSQRLLLAAESNELRATFMRCNAAQILGDAVASCKVLGVPEARQVVVEHEVPVEFHSGPVLLGRVLLNLLKNAMEAPSADGKVVASVSQFGDSLRFSVRNSSVMTDECRSRMFQRSYSTKGAGRGLGTYSVRLFTEAYLGGHVWFESTIVTGTRFTVEVPLNQ